jgi:transposase
MLEHLTFDMSFRLRYYLVMGISSSEIRERALAAYQTGDYTQEEVAAIFRVSTRTFQRWLKQYKEHGSTAPGKRGHRVAVYRGADLRRLDRLIAQNPDATLEELRELTGQSCSLMAVQRAVVRLGYRLKKNAVGQRTKSA